MRCALTDAQTDAATTGAVQCRVQARTVQGCLQSMNTLLTFGALWRRKDRELGDAVL